jgi:F420-dependent oxidoreductase-like protein
MRLRLGLSLASITPLATAGERLFDIVCELAETVEAAGYDALFVPDHMLQNETGGGSDKPMMDAYTLLGGLAARTTRVQLGAFVSPITMRHPALLAKAVSTLDVMSHGRAILGIGAGWDADEHARLGIPFPEPAERVSRLGEALSICRAMFDGASPSHPGRYYRTETAVNVPAPLRRPPILIGGGGSRTLRLAARYADAVNVSAHDLDGARTRLAVLDQACAEVGRDPGQITRTAFLVTGQPAQLAKVADALPGLGIEGLVVALTSADPGHISACAAVLDAVLPAIPMPPGRPSRLSVGSDSQPLSATDLRSSLSGIDLRSKIGYFFGSQACIAAVQSNSTELAKRKSRGPQPQCRRRTAPRAVRAPAARPAVPGRRDQRGCHSRRGRCLDVRCGPGIQPSAGG